MIEINLVPDVKQELLKAQSIRNRVITVSIFIGIMSVVVVTILALYVTTVQAVRSSIADASIKTGSEKLAEVTDLTKTLTIQNQLTKISSLNSGKKINSRIFAVLNAIIPPAPNNVQISNLSIDSTSGTIVIDGQAANSYAAVEVFKKTIAGAIFKYTDVDGNAQEVVLATNISTSNTSYGEDTTGSKVLRFTLSFTYAPELFSPEPTKISIAILVDGNVTDSYLGVPKSVFADRAVDITEGN